MQVNQAQSVTSETRIERAGAQAVMDLLSSEGGSDLQSFAGRFFGPEISADLADYTAAELTAIARSVWTFALEREPNVRKIRVFNPDQSKDGWTSERTVVQAIGEDMPFLVDSVLALITQEEIEIKAVLHPVMPIKRNEGGRITGIGLPGRDPGATRESFLHIEIEQINEPDRVLRLSEEIDRVFDDVRAAVADWRVMLDRVDEAVAELSENPPPVDPQDFNESVSFLHWLRDNHFTFLGCRDYSVEPTVEGGVFQAVAESGFGLLRNPQARVVRRDIDNGALTPEARDFLLQPCPLVITKANHRSTVHRRVHMDYIGVKRYDENGHVIGERRFIGLFTSAAYNKSAREIPLLRRKVDVALLKAGFSPTSHNGKAFLNILEIYPRDELFQVSDQELFETALGMLQLKERPKVRLFERRDEFDRFISAIVFLPRDRYSTELRNKVAEILCEAYDGRQTAFYPRFGDEPLARVHFIIGRNKGVGPDPDLVQLEEAIRQATRTWSDTLREALEKRLGRAEANAAWTLFRDGFSSAYRDAFNTADAAIDIQRISALNPEHPLNLRLYGAEVGADGILRMKLYHAGGAIVLSDCLPVLENMGLCVLDEQSYQVVLADGRHATVHDFGLRLAVTNLDRLDEINATFEDGFLAVWSGAAENDGFNRLILSDSMHWRDVVILRAVAKFLKQSGVPYSQTYMEDALSAHPQIARLLLALFNSRFAPDVGETIEDREAIAGSVRAAIETELELVESLDEDRILRRFCNFFESLLRTNFFQADASGEPKSYLSFKLDSRQLTELPEPRPFAEIFVYSPRFEGVHLRFGKVARGGLRWSDRKEDFRTEILGLVKAQQVKNTVIVPVGSKGGFAPKHLPIGGDRETIQQEAIACYRQFISGLLDLTDNLSGGEIVPPLNVVRHDEDDPYLVVAADKGTATFSDIANEISLDYGFWLGDAFASGGSVGYDHKKMGITARGAWEAVKRHFREIGTDIQSQPFSVVGVGDMSGDVFGNGMLLSNQTRLVAAFDHRDIFVDPDPDIASSFEERQRLFKLPRSSWEDYNADLISSGGGVFSRKAKSIPVSSEIQKLTGLTASRVAPNELIHALLQSEYDLLWFGGIGTYVKASSENNEAVGDRANDGLRISASALKAKVVGEGANLGVTQKGRIEFAKAGGRINTDAIDNAAGVDCSDHEVNIKILLDSIVADGDLDQESRNALLAEMEDEVSDLVLKNNYRQTLAISLSQATAPNDIGAQTRYIRELERLGRLDREIEDLPAEEEIAELVEAKAGLGRPEIAVLTAYSKIALYDALLESDVPDDPHFCADLSEYFPTALRDRFAEKVQNHRLRREIVATEIANIVINAGGSTFINRMRDDLGVSAADSVRAYLIVRNAFALGNLYDQINSLDNLVSAETQTALHLRCKGFLRRQAGWFLQNFPQPMAIGETVEQFAPRIAELRQSLTQYLSDFQRDLTEQRMAEFSALGVPPELASAVASLDPLAAAPDIIFAHQRSGQSLQVSAEAYYAMGAAFGLDKLREGADKLGADDHWERLALARAVDDLSAQQCALTVKALAGVQVGATGDVVESWLKQPGSQIEPVRQLLHDLENGDLTMAKISIAANQLRRLVD
jgi:glutamate dehydrogenase